MNNIILSTRNSTEIAPGKYQIISEQILAHLRDVLNFSAVNESRFNVVIPNSGNAIAHFSENQKGEVICEIRGEVLPTNKRLIHLGIATTRPPMAKRILEHATTLGASSFNFFPATLSEKSYLSSKVYEPEKALTYIEKGMEQCRQFAEYPSFQICKSMKTFIDEMRLKNTPIYWLDHQAMSYFSDEQTKKEIALLIGPERGWTEEEKNYFTENGIMGLKLSDSVMRVEFAINAAFAQLEYISNRRSND